MFTGTKPYDAAADFAHIKRSWALARRRFEDALPHQTAIAALELEAAERRLALAVRALKRDISADSNTKGER